jgi:hypothetical protein
MMRKAGCMLTTTHPLKHNTEEKEGPWCAGRARIISLREGPGTRRVLLTHDWYSLRIVLQTVRSAMRWITEFRSGDEAVERTRLGIQLSSEACREFPKQNDAAHGGAPGS